MNKTELHQTILDALESAYQHAVNAANQAHETATHEETVAENKYDTFGLEASYLAEGQSKRVTQTEADLNTFQKLPIKSFDEDSPIHYGAYIILRDHNEQLKHLFLSPVAGGIAIEFNQNKVLLVTGESPLGKKLIGAYVDDCVTINNIEYEIESVS